MKRTTTVAAISIVIIALLSYRLYQQKKFIQHLQTQRKEYTRSLIAARNELYAEDSTVADIIFIGDSHIELADWSRIFNMPIVNYGIGGDLTADIARRLQSIHRKHPKTVMVNGGINDIGEGVGLDTVVANLDVIFKSLTDSGIRVYYTSILPVGGAKSALNDKIANANAAAQKLCSKYGVQYIPFSDSFKNEYLTVDSVHLNFMGYRAWASMLKHTGLVGYNYTP